MNELIAIQRERLGRSGKVSHFFDPSSMRFFRSRLGAFRHVGPDLYFVTSEQYRYLSHVEPRKFTIRRMNADGSVTTYGEFQQFSTRAKAIAAMNRIAASAELEVA